MIFSSFGSFPSTVPGKIKNILTFDFSTSLNSWLTVVANGLSAPLKTSTLARSCPLIFFPAGRSGPIITTLPFASLNYLGSSEPPGTKDSNAF